MLLVLAGAIGFGAVRLRGRLLPSWDGAPARLAEIVLGISHAGRDPGADRGRRALRARLGPRGGDRGRGRHRPRGRGIARVDRPALATAAADRARRRHRRGPPCRAALGDADAGRARHRDVPAEHDLAQRAVCHPLRPGCPGRRPALHRGAAADRLVLPAELGAAPLGGTALPGRHRLPLAAHEPRLDVALPAGRLVLRPSLRRGGHGAAGPGADPRRRDAAALPARRRKERHRGPLLPARVGRDPGQRRRAGPRCGEIRPPDRGWLSGGGCRCGGAPTPRVRGDGRGARADLPSRSADRRRPRRRSRAGDEAQPAGAVRPAHHRRDRRRRPRRPDQDRADLGRQRARHRRLLVPPQPGRVGQPAPLDRQGAAAWPRPARHRHPRSAHRLGLSGPARRHRDRRLPAPGPPRQLRRPLAADAGRCPRRDRSRRLARPHPDDPDARVRRPLQRDRVPVHAADSGRARGRALGLRGQPPLLLARAGPRCPAARGGHRSDQGEGPELAAGRPRRPAAGLGAARLGHRARGLGAPLPGRGGRPGRCS